MPAEAPKPLPEIGDRVLATINVADFGDEPRIVTRPADVIVPQQTEPWRCNLNVVLDGGNDSRDHRFFVPCSRWFGSVAYDPTGKTAPSWRHLP
jgi:hypothetical protein